MSSPTRAALRIIDIGAPGWCWSRLGSEGEGILSYEGSRGRQSLVVPYTVTGRQITIPLASFNDSGWMAAGREARLEVTGTTLEDLAWVVRATATAERLDPSAPAELAFSRRLHPANSPGQGSTERCEQLFLPSPRVRGFYETRL